MRPGMPPHSGKGEVESDASGCALEYKPTLEHS